ncbi:hypothetical protein [Aquitalea sp. ASV15]|uniref:hypothetical protein n=1 Tax=Aquitalea sp. ASV15 TaxID=2795104 RepID=UPI0018EE32BE|nr:hypothetical protein [Aquitalea sp. ASV15]
MRKNQYLADSDVADFAIWLSSEITKPKLTHRYEKSNGSLVEFNSLADAFKQYEWPFRFTGPENKEFKGKSYKDSEQALAYLAKHLRLALHAGNDNEVCEWACRIMKWGGVSHGNASWLRNNVNGLADEILTVEAALNAEEEGIQALQSVRRFNSGMTKVYSLLIPGFIIYDSRVAAALAWFVNKWCEKTSRKQVPSSLAFPCMPAKEGENPRIRKSRNPSNGTRIFPKLNNQARVHAQWNLRASWLLDECLRHSAPMPFINLRELEAALFMWGYNLNSHETRIVD